jgi:hypothetical protein
MGQWKGSGGLILWIDIDPAVQDEADAWYLDEHLPERVQVAGYRSARRYVAIEAEPRYLSVFEADSPEALASPGYLGLVSRISEQSRRIRAAFRHVVRNTFEVTASHGRARGGVIGSYRLRAAAADRSAADAALSALVENLAHMPGVVAAHRRQRVRGLAAGQFHHIHIRHPIWCRHDHFVARIHGGHKGVE